MRPSSGADAVLHRAIELAGEIHLGAMREMPAMIQAHAQDACHPD